MDPTTLLGVAAAFLTTASNVPQLLKCWRTGEAGDLSLKMLLMLCVGGGLWLVYGVFKADVVIIGANVASLLLLLGILFFKLHGKDAGQAAD